MRIRYKKWARPELEASKFYIDNPEEYKGKWKTLFNNGNPIHLELGCGKGGFISQIAHLNPNINYIAIDLVDAMLGLAKRNIEEKYKEQNKETDNIYITRYDIDRILNIFDQNDRIDITENTTTVETIPNDEPYVSETSYQAIITANIGLNIRNGASINYSRNGGYSKGEIVTIIAESNGWGKTEKGWIYLEYTEKVDNEKEITKEVTAKIGLNIRSGPSTNSNIIGAYPYGKEVIVYSEEEGWAKVKYNGNYGYMYSKYLK